MMPTCIPRRAETPPRVRSARPALGTGRLPAPDRRVRPRPSERGVDRRRRLGDAGVPGRHAIPRRSRRGGPGPAGLPREPRRARRLGEHRGPGARGRQRDDRRSPGWQDRARAGRKPAGHAPRRGDALRRAPPARVHAGALGRGAAPGPGPSPLVRDHGDHRRLGHAGARSRVSCPRRAGRADAPNEPLAVVGASPRPGAARLARAGTPRCGGGSAAGDEREADAGWRAGERDRCAARAISRPDGPPDRQPRDRAHRRPCPCRRDRARARPRRVRSPHARDRRPRGAGRAGRGRGGPCIERAGRPAPAHRARPGGPPGRHPAVRVARGRGDDPAAVGRLGGPDARSHRPVPRPDPGRPGSTRSPALPVPAHASSVGATGRSPRRTCSRRWRSP